jgi:hypothetical protein
MDDVIMRYRFTIKDYHRMGEVGILPDDSRIELIAGDIVVREPIANQLGRRGVPALVVDRHAGPSRETPSP